MFYFLCLIGMPFYNFRAEVKIRLVLGHIYAS